MPARACAVEAGLGEGGADALALAMRQDRDRRQAPDAIAGIGIECHRHEGDLADDRAVLLGDQRQREIAVGAQALHQIRLGRAREGGAQQRIDAGGILGPFGADREAHDVSVIVVEARSSKRA